MIVILPCTVNLEFSIHEQLAAIVARQLTTKKLEVAEHGIAQRMRDWQATDYSNAGRAEGQFQGLTQYGRENQN